jgi:integrase
VTVVDRAGRESRSIDEGEPVMVVSEWLGHANTTTTLTVYQHVHPGMDRHAAERHAALLRG